MARITVSGPIYLDTNIFIYALEGYSVFRPTLTALFESLDRQELTAVTSELTLAEALVKPLLDRHTEREAAYLQVLQSSSSLLVVPVSRAVLTAAARLRAEPDLKLPDAIHVASAQLSTCSTFLTNDARIPSVPRLTIRQLSEL